MGAMTESPLLTVEEAAHLLRWEPETLMRKMQKKVFTLGKHYFRRPGEIGPRFDREALLEWVKEPAKQRNTEGIPLARGGVGGGRY
jgi:hypothetical protein